MNRISIEFLVRSGCHLCEEVAPAVRLAARLSGSTVDMVDVDTDDRLVRDYGLRIPVVLIRDEPIAEGDFSAAYLWWRIVRERVRADTR